MVGDEGKLILLITFIVIAYTAWLYYLGDFFTILL